MDLNPREAQRLVDSVSQASDAKAATAAAQTALTFLISQLHLLGAKANGYPRNPIEGSVWGAGRALTVVCDKFADAVAGWDFRRGEEQAARLATTMAMQIMGHYPEEIFPRVLRCARCSESLDELAEAADSYRCIIGDFVALDLEDLLDTDDPPEGSKLTILSCLNEALAGVRRLTPQAFSQAEATLQEKVTAALARSV